MSEELAQVSHTVTVVTVSVKEARTRPLPVTVGYRVPECEYQASSKTTGKPIPYAEAKIIKSIYGISI